MLSSLFLTAALVSPAQDDLQIPADTEIVTTESGLKYSVLSRGDGKGESPNLGDQVQVHYTGWLEDGKVFDSSVRRGVPASFGLGHVIEGWNEGLQLMQVGDKFKFTIPGELGYGADGTPDGSIPPGATLIFEVELLAIPIRGVPYMPWVAEGAEKTETGTEYRTIAKGGDKKMDGADIVVLDFAFWGTDGKILQSSVLNGGPLLVDPAQMPLTFLTELAPSLTEGSHLQVRVPVSTVPGVGFDDYETVEGQIMITAIMKFEKPEFVLPPDEELTTTETGLKYKIIKEGSSMKPSPGTMVAAHYAGWLTDGTQFDASYDRGSPLQSSLRNLIKGWQEGIPLVGHGGQVILVVPPELGYGDAAKPNIPAGSTLVFVIELINHAG